MNYGLIRILETGEELPEHEYRTRFPNTSFAVDAAPPGTERIEDAPVVLPRHLTVLAFRNRFTKPEKVRIELAAIDDPAADQVQRERAAMVRVGQADLAAATYVDVDRADTREDVQGFEAMGLLDAPGRALEILDDEIQPHERHYG